MGRRVAVTSDDVTEVVVGVVCNARGEVFIARRSPHVHQGGMWEFPGGKVRPGEGRWQALQRELSEELGIEPRTGRPLIEIVHAYPEVNVRLDVWLVHAFAGTPSGREGQEVAWVAPARLEVDRFPVANRAIVHALRLPSLYAISDEPRQGSSGFLHRLEGLLASGVRLVQLRAKTLGEDDYRDLARRALRLCRAYGGQLLLNAEPSWAEDLGADGVHLTSRRLMHAPARPLGAEHWVAASCHNADEVAHACRIGVDFIVVAPVLPTATHPGGQGLGWHGVKALTGIASVPVYALGGLSPQDLGRAYAAGAQGIAAISSLWGRVADGSGTGGGAATG